MKYILIILLFASCCKHQPHPRPKTQTKETLVHWGSDSITGMLPDSMQH